MFTLSKNINRLGSYKLSKVMFNFMNRKNNKSGSKVTCNNKISDKNNSILKLKKKINEKF